MASRQRTFRVFVSSTFSDLVAERDALQSGAFRALRDFCRARGARFQPVDLRWGVSEEAGLDQRTLEICLEELRRCQRVTPRPNFIVLLGQRYGWRPLPPRIAAAEFDALDAVLSPGERDLLHRWYRRDDNAVPAEYRLLPRRGPYEDATTWAREEAALRAALVPAARRVAPERWLDYEASATHREIAHGALSIPDAGRHVFCYLRRIDGLPPDAAAFLDLLHGEPPRPDPEARAGLERLERELRVRLPPDHVHDYRAEWRGAGPTAEHLRALSGQVEQDLAALIADELRLLERVSELDQEVQAQREFGRERAAHFRGREDVLRALTDYLAGDAARPLAVHGPSGSGKTALLARAAAEPFAGVVVARYLGATAASSDVRPLLEGLCREIGRAYGDEAPVPGEFRELVADFVRRLGLATEARPLAVFLDSLDQLGAADNGRSLAWLPRELPPHARLVVSVLDADGPAGDCRRAAERLLGSDRLLPLGPLSDEHGGRLLDDWLAEAGRTLGPVQREEVLGKFARCPLPLYLKLAFEEARLWTSSHAVPDLSPDIPGILAEMLARLEQEAEHGRVLVGRALGLLAAARHGLGEEELLDLLSADAEVLADFRRRSPRSPRTGRLPPVVWSRLYFDLEPYLSEREADATLLLTFYHRQVGEAVGRRYLAGDGRRRAHAAVAAHFAGQQNQFPGPDGRSAFNLRKLSELPFQLGRAAAWPELEQTLTDLGFVEAKCAAGRTYDLAADYQAALGPEGLPADRRDACEEFARFVLAQAHVLARRPALTFQQAANEPDATAPARAARQRLAGEEARAWMRWLNKPDAPSPCLRTFVGHLQGLTECDVSPDGRRVVSCGDDETLRLWDVATGAEIVTLFGHGSGVQTCAFSPDGSRLASADWRGVLKLWDAETGAELATVGRHDTRVNNLDFGSDGRVATASDDGTVRVWDAAALRELRQWRVGSGAAISCAFSPDGRTVASGDINGGVKLWDVAGDRARELEGGHDKDVMMCLFSRDGRWLFTASDDMTLRKWDLSGASPPVVFAGHADGVSCCSLSPDGKLVATGSQDKTLKLWDADGREVATITGHAGPVMKCRFLPDGRHLVSASADATLRLWDVTAALRSARPRTARPAEADARPRDKLAWRRCAFSPDGTQLLAGSEDDLRVWDLSTGAVRLDLDGKAYNGGCLFSPDGTWILSAHRDGALRRWDARTGEPLGVRESGGPDVWQPAISPDGKRFLACSDPDTLRVYDAATGELLHELSGGGANWACFAAAPDWTWGVAGDVDGKLRVWDLTTWEEAEPFAGHAGELRSCAVSPDGRRLVSGDMAGVVKLWDVASRAELASVAAHAGPAQQCGFTPDGRRVVTASWDRMLKVWDAERLAPLATLRGHAGDVWGFAISPDGRRLATASYGDATVRLWDLDAGAQIALLVGPRDAAGVCAFSPDGGGVVTASHRRALKLWDGDTGRERATLIGHTAEVRACAFSPDGRRVVSASLDHTLRLWDAQSATTPALLAGHAGPVVSCAFSPDGARVASGSWDRTVRLWDASTAAEETALAGHEDWVTGVLFSPDGRRVVSWGLDRTVRVWDAATRTEVVRLAGHRAAVEVCVFSPDGSRLLTGSADGTLKVWGAEGRELATLTGHAGAVRCCAFAPDGRRAASGGMDGALRLWDTETGRQTAAPAGHESWVTCCAFAADGRLLSGSDDGFVRLWDAGGSPRCEYWAGAPVHSVAWRPGGAALAAGDAQGRLHLLRAEGL